MAYLVWHTFEYILDATFNLHDELNVTSPLWEVERLDDMDMDPCLSCLLESVRSWWGGLDLLTN